MRSLVLTAAWDMFYKYEKSIPFEECLNASRKAYNSLF